MPPNHEAPLTRPSLILRLRDPEDLQAWQDFVEIYQPIIRELARKRGLQQADADDVTQEVLTRIAKSIGKWDPDPKKGSFRGWLATVTRNLVIQFFRNSNRLPSTGFDSQVGDVLGRSSSHAQEFELERERQLFLWAARKVQPRFAHNTWQAFWLTAVKGETVTNVADRLHINKAQVYVARSRVMSLLKRAVEQTQFDSFIDEGEP